MGWRTQRGERRGAAAGCWVGRGLFVAARRCRGGRGGGPALLAAAVVKSCAAWRRLSAGPPAQLRRPDPPTERRRRGAGASEPAAPRSGPRPSGAAHAPKPPHKPPPPSTTSRHPPTPSCPPPQVSAYTGDAELEGALKGAELVIIPAGAPHASCDARHSQDVETRKRARMAARHSACALCLARLTRPPYVTARAPCVPRKPGMTRDDQPSTPVTPHASNTYPPTLTTLGSLNCIHQVFLASPA